MAKKVIILNIPSEPELIYVLDGAKITKKKYEELRKELGNKLKIINKDLPNMKIYDPENRSTKSNDIVFEDEIIDDEDEAVKEMFFTM